MMIDGFGFRSTFKYNSTGIDYYQDMNTLQNKIIISSWSKTLKQNRPHRYRSFWSITPAERCHDDVIKWKHFPRYWPFVRGIHRSPVNSPHKGQWHGAFVFFDLRLNKWLSKQYWGWWFEKLSRPLWRHRNGKVMTSTISTCAVIMTWKHFMHQWPFVRGFHWSPVESPHKGLVMWSFDVFFIAILNKLLNIQPRCLWY